MTRPGVALVTGASSGIGEAIARGLAADGYTAGAPAPDAQDVAAAVRYVFAQPPHVAVNEVLLRPATQRS